MIIIKIYRAIRFPYYSLIPFESVLSGSCPLEIPCMSDLADVLLESLRAGSFSTHLASKHSPVPPCSSP